MPTPPRVSISDVPGVDGLGGLPLDACVGGCAFPSGSGSSRPATSPLPHQRPGCPGLRGKGELTKAHVRHNKSPGEALCVGRANEGGGLHHFGSRPALTSSPPVSCSTLKVRQNPPASRRTGLLDRSSERSTSPRGVPACFALLTDDGQAWGKREDAVVNQGKGVRN